MGATDTEQCSLATYLAKIDIWVLSDRVLVVCSLISSRVARNEADGGRYPFPYSIKLGSHEGMNKLFYFAFVDLVVYWSGLRGAGRGAGVKKKTRRIKVTKVKIPARSTR